MNRSNLIEQIIKNINKNIMKLTDEFALNKKEKGIGFCYIDKLLDDSLAKEIYQAFPREGSPWREMNSFREKKLTTKQFQDLPNILRDITFALQSDEVLKVVESITDIDSLVGDETLYAGGLSAMRCGDFLNPHIDNSHDQNREFYRRVNALYYVSPGWKREFGGHLELWDRKVKKPIEIESNFNRLVFMETNPWSWHSVSKVKKAEDMRCCVSNYYFSKESPSGEDYYHVTSFSGRPNEPFKRFASSIDNIVRNSIRILKKDGIGKKDQYLENKKK